jgi:hypothetical protein
MLKQRPKTGPPCLLHGDRCRIRYASCRVEVDPDSSPAEFPCERHGAECRLQWGTCFQRMPRELLPQEIELGKIADEIRSKHQQYRVSLGLPPERPPKDGIDRSGWTMEQIWADIRKHFVERAEAEHEEIRAALVRAGRLPTEIEEHDALYLSVLRMHSPGDAEMARAYAKVGMSPGKVSAVNARRAEREAAARRAEITAEAATRLA